MSDDEAAMWEAAARIADKYEAELLLEKAAQEREKKGARCDLEEGRNHQTQASNGLRDDGLAVPRDAGARPKGELSAPREAVAGESFSRRGFLDATRNNGSCKDASWTCSRCDFNNTSSESVTQDGRKCSMCHTFDADRTKENKSTQSKVPAKNRKGNRHVVRKSPWDIAARNKSVGEPHANSTPSLSTDGGKPTSRTPGPSVNAGSSSWDNPALNSRRSGLSSLRSRGATTSWSTTLGTFAVRDDDGPFPLKYDPDAIETWIYPQSEKYPTRKYQRSIVERALFTNTLVVLPTGLGKTFIAAVLMYNFNRWFPEGKIIFMAPTRPLVMQQVQACHSIVGIPSSITCVLTGKTKTDERRKHWAEKRLFYCTPQTVDKDCKSGIIPLDKIVLVVVDEAHRAVGNYAFAEVVREIQQNGARFRLLALSATPGRDAQKVQEVISNLVISGVEYKSEDDPDVAPYVFTKDINIVKVHGSSQQREINKVLRELVKIPKDRLCQANISPILEYSTITYEQAVMVNRQVHLNGLGAHLNLMQVRAWLGALMSLLQVQKLLVNQGVQSAMTSLERAFAEGPNKLSSFKRQLKQTHHWERLVTMFKSAGDEANPKLWKLKELLEEHFRRMRSGGTTTSVIVFAQFRDTVAMIKAFLDKHSSLRVSPFVGQSSSKTKRNEIDSQSDGHAVPTVATKGQCQREQQQIVRDFKAGLIDVLISTSIGEEGLDIGSVDLTIAFDALASPIRMTQRFGRTGRKRAGSVVMLVSAEGSEQDAIVNGKAKSMKIHRLLRSRLDKLKFHLPTSMFPSGVRPKVVYKALDIEDYRESQVIGLGKRRRSSRSNGEESGSRKGKRLGPHELRPLSKEEFGAYVEKYQPGNIVDQALSSCKSCPLYPEVGTGSRSRNLLRVLDFIRSAKYLAKDAPQASNSLAGNAPKVDTSFESRDLESCVDAEKLSKEQFMIDMFSSGAFADEESSPNGGPRSVSSAPGQDAVEYRPDEGAREVHREEDEIEVKIMVRQNPKPTPCPSVREAEGAYITSEKPAQSEPRESSRSFAARASRSEHHPAENEMDRPCSSLEEDIQVCTKDTAACSPDADRAVWQPRFSVGETITVQSRTSPGINIPGGVGKIKRLHPESRAYDVFMIVDRRNLKQVPENFIFPGIHPDLDRELHQSSSKKRSEALESGGDVKHGDVLDGEASLRVCPQTQADLESLRRFVEKQGDYSCSSESETESLCETDVPLPPILSVSGGLSLRGNSFKLCATKEAFCAICQGASSRILECNQCHVRVHPACYGVQATSCSQSWRCDSCAEAGERTGSCILCPFRGGALKTVGFNCWVHVSCCTRNPMIPTSYDDAESLTSLGLREAIRDDLVQLDVATCSICGLVKGACAPCEEPECLQLAHVTCSLKLTKLNKVLCKGHLEKCLPLDEQKVGEPRQKPPACNETNQEIKVATIRETGDMRDAGATVDGDGQQKVSEDVNWEVSSLKAQMPPEKGCRPEAQAGRGEQVVTVISSDESDSSSTSESVKSSRELRAKPRSANDVLVDSSPRPMPSRSRGELENGPETKINPKDDCDASGHDSPERGMVSCTDLTNEAQDVPEHGVLGQPSTHQAPPVAASPSNIGGSMNEEQVACGGHHDDDKNLTPLVLRKSMRTRVVADGADHEGVALGVSADDALAGPRSENRVEPGDKPSPLWPRKKAQNIVVDSSDESDGYKSCRRSSSPDSLFESNSSIDNSAEGLGAPHEYNSSGRLAFENTRKRLKASRAKKRKRSRSRAPGKERSAASGFIDDEASVSGEDSGDEEEHSDLDKDLEGLIDDQTQDSQGSCVSQGAMAGIYGRSLIDTPPKLGFSTRGSKVAMPIIEKALLEIQNGKRVRKCPERKYWKFRHRTSLRRSVVQSNVRPMKRERRGSQSTSTKVRVVV